MFTEDELEGVQGARLEQWLQDHEAVIRSIARTFDSHDHWQGSKNPYYEDSEKLSNIIGLLTEVYWLRKTYA